jgi:hypothetical protein
VQDSASDFTFPEPRKRGRVRLRAFLQGSKHDLRSGRLREAGQFVERAFGVEPPGAPGHEAHQGGALVSFYCAVVAARTAWPCDCSFADEPQFISGDIHDGRRRPSRGDSGVDQQINPGAEF